MPKSDTLDAERIARDLLAHPDLPLAFKRSQRAARPDQVVELLGLWHHARRSLLKSQQHQLNEAEDMLQALPEAIRDRLPASKAVWPRLREPHLPQNHTSPSPPASIPVRVTRRLAEALVQISDQIEPVAEAAQQWLDAKDDGDTIWCLRRARTLPRRWPSRRTASTRSSAYPDSHGRCRRPREQRTASFRGQFHRKLDIGASQ
jgi:hypothetical protein